MDPKFKKLKFATGVVVPQTVSPRWNACDLANGGLCSANNAAVLVAVATVAVGVGAGIAVASMMGYGGASGLGGASRLQFLAPDGNWY